MKKLFCLFLTLFVLLPSLGGAEIIKFNCGLIPDKPISYSWTEVEFDTQKRLVKYAAWPWVEAVVWKPDYISWVNFRKSEADSVIVLNTFNKRESLLLSTSHYNETFKYGLMSEMPMRCAKQF